jgi:hypothetical protein
VIALVICVGAIASLVWAAPAASQSLTIDAPPALEWAAERVKSADWQQLDEALALAWLDLPAAIEVTLIADADARAVRTPRWIVGVALPPGRIVIFPERTAPYPHGSLESVVRHEAAHLALTARAGGRDLPRWFHEGVAVGVEGGWGVVDQVRLLAALAGNPSIEEMDRLFGTGDQPDSARAYLLATALVDHVRQQHGAGVPGGVATRVAAGVPFERAFALETGETVGAARAAAWEGHLRWTRRILVLASPSGLWTMVMLLAAAAFAAQRRRRARHRHRWENDPE